MSVLYELKLVSGPSLTGVRAGRSELTVLPTATQSLNSGSLSPKEACEVHVKSSRDSNTTGRHLCHSSALMLFTAEGSLHNNVIL